MPTSTIAHTIQPCIDAFNLDDHPRRTPMHYGIVQAKLLKRLVQIQQAQSCQTVPFILGDLLLALNTPVFALKGSSVGRWAEPDNLDDIDLQIPWCPADGNDHGQPLLKACIQFLETRNQHRVGQGNGQRSAAFARLSQIAKHADGAWQRTVIRLGVPQRNCSTIDINCTPRGSTLGFDTLSASSALIVNTEHRWAMQVDAISPELKQWMIEHSLVWFNPMMDGGLQRISYRLARCPGLECLQPYGFDVALEKANADDLQTVLGHLLKNVTLDKPAQQEGLSLLWRDVVSALGDDLEHSAPTLRNHLTQATYHDFVSGLLGWTGTKNLAELHEMLMNPDHQPRVLNGLRTACCSALGFLTDLRQVLKVWPNAEHWMKQYGAACLGYTVVSPERLFKLMESATWIDQTPEVESRMMLEPILMHWCQHDDPAIREQAQTTLGWLNQEPRASLTFWLQRIHREEHRIPDEEQTDQLLKCIGNALLTTESPADWPTGLEHLNLSRSQLQRLVNVVEAQRQSQSPTSCSDLHWPAWVKVLNLQTEFQNLIANMGRELKWGQAWPQERIVEASALLAWAETCRQTFNEHGLPIILKPLVRREAQGFRVHTNEAFPAVVWTENQLTGDMGPTRFTLKQGPIWIQSIQASRHKTQHHLIWADTGHVVCRGGEIEDKHLEHLTVDAQHIGPEERPVFNWLLSVLKAQTGQEWAMEGTVRAYGRCNERLLLQAPTASKALQALQNGGIVWQGPHDLFRIVIDIENHQPREYHLSTNGMGGLPSISGHFISQGQSWLQVQPAYNNIWCLYEVGFQPLCTAMLRLKRSFDPGTQTLGRQVDIQHQGTPSYRFTGTQENPRYLTPSGVLDLYGPKAAKLEFDASKAPDNIPIETIPLMAELMGERRYGSQPLKARLHDGRKGIPPKDYEGFIYGLGNAQLSMSGYLWPNGRLIGCMQAEVGEAHGLVKRAWIGSFVLKRPHEAPDCRGMEYSAFNPKPFDLTIMNRVQHVAEGILMPHGYCEEHVVAGHSGHRITHDRKIYFGGHSVLAKQITREKNIVFDSGNEPSYFVTQFTDSHHVKMMSHLVMNAPDGGPDFVLNLPANSEKMASYLMHLSDMEGFYMSLLTVDQIPRHGHFVFPSGLELRMGIQINDRQLVPAKKVTVDFNGLRFSANLHSDGKLLDLKERDEYSRKWLLEKALPSNLLQTLPQLLLLISQGQLKWNNDCAPHLRLREFDALKPIAQVLNG